VGLRAALYFDLSFVALLNGKADEIMYQRRRGDLEGDLDFTELKTAHINPAARAAGPSPDFSQRIRQGRPGF